MPEITVGGGNGRSRPTLVFSVFLALGFLIAVGLALSITHLAVDQTMSRIHRLIVEDKAAGLKNVADVTIIQELTETRSLARSPIVRYRFLGKLSETPEMARVVLFDADGDVITRGEDVRDALVGEAWWAVLSRRQPGRPDASFVTVSENGFELLYAAPARTPDGEPAMLVEIQASPVTGAIGEGLMRIVNFDASAPTAGDAAGADMDYIVYTPLIVEGLALRYSLPYAALAPQREWITSVVSMALIVGLVIAFSLIFFIGRRLILRPQVSLARSRERLRRSEEEARRLALVAERASDHIMITDTEGRLTWANRAMQEGTGYRLEEVVGRKPREFLFGPETPEAVRRTIAEARINGVFAEARSTNRKKSGETYIADIALTPVRDDSGEIDCYIAVERDVTVSAQAEERLKNAVEAIDDQFGIIGRSGRFRIFNRAYSDWAARLGMNLEVGTPYIDAQRELAHSDLIDLGGKDPDEWVAGNVEKIESGEGLELYVSDRGGRTTYRRMKRLVTGETVIIGTDVTELIQARQRAEAAVEAKSRFTASISHELRTPLTGVISMADLLLDDDMPESQRSGIELISRSGGALLNIINDILDLSKLEEGRLTIRPERFDIVAMVEDVYALMTPAAAEKALEFSFRFDPETPRWVIGDEGRIRQIITNLAGNALKFTAEGEVAIRLGSERRGDEARMWIEVEDTGSGVSPEDLERIFAPYEQAAALSASSAQAGAGLGLSICRQLAEMMEGRLDAHSTPGRGSTFWFEATLPLAAGEEAAAPLPAGALVETWGADPHCGALEDHLGAMGAHVARGPGAALCERRAPALRLIALDGQGAPPRAAPRFEARPGGPPTIVVAPHGRARDETEQTILAQELAPGVCALLRRPVRGDLLVRTIARLLAESRPAKAAVPGFGAGEADRAERCARASGTDADAGDGAAALPLVALVEDNETNALVVGAMVKDLPIRYRRFVDAVSALEAFQNDRPALILMDMNLPDMSGVDAAREIRAQEGVNGAPRCAVLGFTASAGENDHEACLAAGMDGVLTKPVTRSSLLAAIESRLPPSAQTGDEGPRRDAAARSA